MQKFAPNVFFSFFLCWLSVFLCIRYFTLPELGYDSLPSDLMRFRAAFSGVLADIWIASVLSVVFGFLWSALLAKLNWKLGLASLLSLALIFFALGFLVGTQVPYVRFFGHFLAWQHLRYLSDFEFIFSSGADLADAHIWICAGAATLCGIALPTLIFFLKPKSHTGFTTKVSLTQRVTHRMQSSVAARFLAPLGLLLFGGLCQITKVQLNTTKVGWSVPVTLRVNFLENALLEFAFAQQTPDISPAQFQTLVDWQNSVVVHELPPPAPPPSRGVASESLLPTAQAALPGGQISLSDDSLKKILERNWRPAADGSVGDGLRKIFSQRILAQEPIFVFVVILESFRPEESRAFFPELSQTGTPFLDELSNESVLFSNTYTAGGVTRAGQEALLCGLLSSEYTSAMRDLPSAQPRCLSNLLRESYGTKAFSGWWHGGAFNFDSQGTFWKRQKTDFVLSREDFDPSYGVGSSLLSHSQSYPSTGWGVSDFFLVRRFKEQFMQLPQWPNISLHSLLSVTNHPGWVLPTDAPSSRHSGTHPENEFQKKLPALLTTRYTDEALRQLVVYLKEQSCLRCKGGTIWDNSLFLVSNDHGTLVPSLRNPKGYDWGITPELDAAAASAASKATLLFSGGLTQEAAVSIGAVLPIRDAILRSQLDVFATLTDLFGLSHAATVGDSLFASSRRWPVIVDLGDRLYFPGAADGQEKVVTRASLFARARKKSGNLLRSDETIFLGIQSLHEKGLSGK